MTTTHRWRLEDRSACGIARIPRCSWRKVPGLLGGLAARQGEPTSVQVDLSDDHGDLVADLDPEARNWSTVRLLIDLGFGVNGVTAAGATVLHHAAAADDLSIARLLVEHGADHTAREPGFNAQPAGWAQYFKKRETQKYLESLA